MYLVIQKPLPKLIQQENQNEHLVLFRAKNLEEAELFIELRISKNFPWFDKNNFLIAKDVVS